MKEIKLTDNFFDNMIEGTRYNRAPAGGRDDIDGYKHIVKKHLLE